MNLPYEHAPIIALVFFFVFFLLAGYRAYRPSAKQAMQKHAHIPLKDENHD